MMLNHAFQGLGFGFRVWVSAPEASWKAQPCGFMHHKVKRMGVCLPALM